MKIVHEKIFLYKVSVCDINIMHYAIYTDATRTDAAFHRQ